MPDPSDLEVRVARIRQIAEVLMGSPLKDLDRITAYLKGAAGVTGAQVEDLLRDNQALVQRTIDSAEKEMRLELDRHLREILGFLSRIGRLPER